MDSIIYTFQDPNVPTSTRVAPYNAADITHVAQRAHSSNKEDVWLFDDRTDRWVHYKLLDGKLRKVAGVI